MQLTFTYGKSVEDMLASFNNRVTAVYEQDFLKQNDYLTRFLRYQRTTLLSLAEEMKNKIVTSLLTTNKIIQDGSKERLAAAKKELGEIEVLLTEREKSSKKLEASLTEGQDILSKIKAVNTSTQPVPTKAKQIQKFEGTAWFNQTSTWRSSSNKTRMLLSLTRSPRS